MNVSNKKFQLYNIMIFSKNNVEINFESELYQE